LEIVNVVVVDIEQGKIFIMNIIFFVFMVIIVEIFIVVVVIIEIHFVIFIFISVDDIDFHFCVFFIVEDDFIVDFAEGNFIAFFFDFFLFEKRIEIDVSFVRKRL
jgi:hypothetical protein